MKPSMPRGSRTTIVGGILCLVLIVVALQVWLLMAPLNAYLGGDESVLWPATLLSLVCGAFNLGLLRYLEVLEGS